LAHFVFIRYIFTCFGIMYQEKSGNPDMYVHYPSPSSTYVGTYRKYVQRSVSKPLNFGLSSPRPAQKLHSVKSIFRRISLDKSLHHFRHWSYCFFA
jgi:hypothetical protein